MNKSFVYGGIMIAIVIAIAALMVSFHPTDVPQVSGISNYDTLGITGLQLGAGCNNSFSACTAKTFTKMNGGSCIIWASSQTIAASSTALVSCQAGISTLTALSGKLSSGDNVFVTAPTSTSAVSDGLVVTGATASSTAPGFIDVRVANLTGTTFTWTATASSTWSWFANL